MTANTHKEFFNGALQDTDPELYESISGELTRQRVAKLGDLGV